MLPWFTTIEENIRDLKKKTGVGGTYKNDFIEIHGEKYEQVANFLGTKKIAFKKIGG